jgi:hypothetical protein
MTMRTLLAVLLSGWVLAAAYGEAPRVTVERSLTHLPKELKLKEPSPQSYRFTCDYYHVTPTGEFMRKQRVTADYVRALPDGKVRWSNVTFAEAKGLDDPFPVGEKQPYMEGFTYRLVDTPNMLKPEFFPGFPASAVTAKNLVWDTHMIEQFGQDHLADLKLNEPRRLQSGPMDLPLAGAGTFRNRQVELTWLGVTRMNDELCALIQYRSFLNQLNVSVSGFTMKGTSTYWGEIWVSLKDKQIEHATLYEDVVIQMAGQQAPQVISVFRKGILEKQVQAGARPPS